MNYTEKPKISDLSESEIKKMSVVDKIKNIYIPFLKEDLAVAREAIDGGRADLKELEAKLLDILENLRELSKDSRAAELRGASMITYYEQAQKIREEIKEKIRVPEEIKLGAEDIEEVIELEEETEEAA